MTRDAKAHNREAWDREVERDNPWTRPVGPDVVARARQGDWSVVLTPTRPVPRAWFGDLAGKDVLALASGGGQQGPVLAAAGARVTVLDQSPRQLAQDRLVAERDGLDLRLEQGDMEDLSRFADASFDLVFHPTSNLFTPDVRAVWRGCFRVLRPGGRLLAGFANPDLFVFDRKEADAGRLVPRWRVPYADVDVPSAERGIPEGDPLEWGHTLEDQIGGQLSAGFTLVDLFEDGYGGDVVYDRHIRSFLATLAVKPATGARIA